MIHAGHRVEDRTEQLRIFFSRSTRENNESESENTRMHYSTNGPLDLQKARAL
jgi:hypothetical protein